MLPAMVERVCGLLVMAIRKDPELVADLLESATEMAAKVRALEGDGKRWPAPPSTGRG